MGRTAVVGEIHNDFTAQWAQLLRLVNVNGTECMISLVLSAFMSKYLSICLSCNYLLLFLYLYAFLANKRVHYYMQSE